jgi:hypothetical protein
MRLPLLALRLKSVANRIPTGIFIVVLLPSGQTQGDATKFRIAMIRERAGIIVQVRPNRAISGPCGDGN